MHLKRGLRAAKGRKHCLQVESCRLMTKLVWSGPVLMAEGKAVGRPRSALDMIVAAVSETHGCLVVTDNEKDFWGIKTFNPLRQSTSAGVQ